LLSGYDPSESPSRFPPLQSLVPTLPVQLIRLITQMLELDESKRPASIKVVQQELQQATLPAPSPSRQYAPVSSVPKSFNPPVSVPIPAPTNRQIQVQQPSIPHPELVRAQARIQDKLARTQSRIDNNQKMDDSTEIQKNAIGCGSLLALLAIVPLILGIGNQGYWAAFGFLFYLSAVCTFATLIRECPVPVPTSRKIEVWIGKSFATTAVLFGVAMIILTFTLHANLLVVVGGVSIIIEGVLIWVCVKI
jgi:hypothetical protein